MTRERVQLARYVEPEITEARIARQWAAVEQRGLPSDPASRWGFRGLALSGVPVLLALALFVWWGAPHQALPGDAFVESAEAPIALRLHDGSGVELDARTRLRVLRDQVDAVELALASGAARFDVTHVKGRTFTVALGSALVTVVGTRFDVARSERPEGTLVRVSVSRGVVEVRRLDQPGSVRRLSAGETWSALLPAKQHKPPAAAVVSAPVAVPKVETVASVEKAVELGDDAEGAAVQAPEVQESVVRAHRGLVAPVSARAIFQRANLARRAGQMSDAAGAYGELLRRYSHDPRAGLSAFELGRIRMDALNDPKGAVEAFSSALGLSAKAGFREDALARMVVAYGTMGEHAACKKARQRYLASYPQGVHVVSLAARCN